MAPRWPVMILAGLVIMLIPPGEVLDKSIANRWACPHAHPTR